MGSQSRPRRKELNHGLIHFESKGRETQMTTITATTVCIAGHKNEIQSILVEPDGSAFFGSDYDFCLTCGEPNDRDRAIWHNQDRPDYVWIRGTKVNTSSFDDATTADLFNELANLVGLDDLLGTPVTDTQIKLGRSATIAIIKRLSVLENEVARLQPPF